MFRSIDLSTIKVIKLRPPAWLGLAIGAKQLKELSLIDERDELDSREIACTATTKASRTAIKLITLINQAKLFKLN
jgi:hypothetical protein